MKGAKKGRKKPTREQWFGSSFSVAARKWMQLDRILDRENDWYEETVIDPETGQIVHYCAEPLSQHTGRGSAKRRKRKD